MKIKYEIVKTEGVFCLFIKNKKEVVEYLDNSEHINQLLFMGMRKQCDEIIKLLPKLIIELEEEIIKSNYGSYYSCFELSKKYNLPQSLFENINLVIIQYKIFKERG